MTRQQGSLWRFDEYAVHAVVKVTQVLFPVLQLEPIRQYTMLGDLSVGKKESRTIRRLLDDFTREKAVLYRHRRQLSCWHP